MKCCSKFVVLVILFCAYCTNAQEEEITDPGTDTEPTSNQLDPKRAGRINQGTQVSIANYPFAVSMVIVGQGGDTYNQIGTIISSTHVITTATPLFKASSDGNISSIEIRAGSDSQTDGGSTFQYQSYEIHPQYDRDTEKNSIAVITIQGNFSGTPNVQPIEIQTSVIPFSATNTTYCVTVGWGSDILGAPVQSLNRADYKLVSDDTCAEWFGGTVPSSQHCAESVSGNICYGETGSPIVCNNRLYGLFFTEFCSGQDKFVMMPSSTVLSFVAKYVPSLVSQTATNQTVANQTAANQTVVSQPVVQPTRINYMSCPCLLC